MEPLIYYPTFEPPNDTWMKFALLYFESFRPIVPQNRRGELSPGFRRIMDQTDLISLYAPGLEEGYRASLQARDEAAKVLSDPYGRSPLLREVNVLRSWRNRDTWSFEVYSEKFSPEWRLFCEEHRIGAQTDSGMLLPEGLAFLYMTYLAKEIAFSEGAAIITDNTRFDNFTNYARATTPTVNSRNRFAKGIISLLVPRDLGQIPIEQVIRFRSRNRELIRAFNQELDNVQEKIASGYSEQDFIDSYNRVYSEFSREVFLLGMEVATIPIAAYLLLNNSTAASAEYVQEILGALGIILGGGYALNKGLVDSQSRRYCKKYFANLKSLR